MTLAPRSPLATPHPPPAITPAITPTPLQSALAAPEVQDHLYRLVFKLTRNARDAEELTQETAATALERDTRGKGWSGEPPPLFTFLGSVLNGVLSNFRRRLGRRRRKEVPDDHDAPADTPSAEVGADESLVEAEAQREEDAIKTDLRAYFASRPDGQLPLQVLEAWEADVVEGEEVAARIGCTRKEIYRARDRIADRLASIAAQRRGESSP